MSAPRALALAGALALAAAPAVGWLSEGHRRIAAGAVAVLPDEVPPFFRAGVEAIAHLAVDPDVYRSRDTPALAAREALEHYVHIESLPPGELPVGRWAFVERLAARGVPISSVGLLPYATVESAERLALCFAEQRRWPADATIRAKCLNAAGVLAHYAADLEQPLHTTVHHDGWALPDGESPLAGIHRRIDALIGDEVALDSPATLAGVELRPIEDPLRAIESELAASHARLDTVYALEPRLGVAGDPRVAAFVCAHYRAATRFVAELYLWAWERSAAIELPEWLER